MKRIFLLLVLLLAFCVAGYGDFLGYYTTTEQITFDLNDALDSSGAPIGNIDTAWVVVRYDDDVGAVDYTAQDAEILASLPAWLDTCLTYGDTLFTFTDAAADIDGDNGVGKYSITVTLWTEGIQTRTSHKFELVDTTFNSTLNKAARDSIPVPTLDATKLGYIDQAISDGLEEGDSITAKGGYLTSIDEDTTRIDINNVTIAGAATVAVLGAGSIQSTAFAANAISDAAVANDVKTDVYSISGSAATADSLEAHLMSMVYMLGACDDCYQVFYPIGSTPKDSVVVYDGGGNRVLKMWFDQSNSTVDTLAVDKF